MCDSATNQAHYPQPKSQTPGCGFPMAKIVVLFSLVTGAVLEVMIAPFTTSELTMARSLYQHLCPEDVVVADRLYGTYPALFMKGGKGVQTKFGRDQLKEC